MFFKDNRDRYTSYQSDIGYSFPRQEGARMSTTEISPGQIMTQMLLGNRVQQAIYVAAKLGIADLLVDGPKSSGELAHATGAHPGALYRLLHVLTGYGIFASDDQQRFELTPLASLLRDGTRNSKRAFALWSGGLSYELFGALEYSVMTGRPAINHIHGMDFLDYLAQNPEVGNLFDAFMSRQTAPLGPVLAAYDFTGVNTIVDVGGGRGELLVAILNAHPTMRGILIDTPRVIQDTKCFLEGAGIADRCTLVGGDIFESVPGGGDAYILKSVIHGVDDDMAARLLTNCRKAMNPSGKLLLVEIVMPSGNEPSPGKLMDLLMLVGSYGRERTEEEFRSLFSAAALRTVKILTTKYVYSVIEGGPG